jgi:Zn-dependent M28 family amino/carboxypeptidase
MFYRMPGQSNTGPLSPLSAEQQLLSSRLRQHVFMLAGDIGARSLTSAPDNLEKAANYIEHVFRSFSLQTTHQRFAVQVFDSKKRQVTEQGISFGNTEHETRNVIAEITGTSLPTEIVVVGAHYDSVYDCPGANDNATGVSALLEIAAEMSRQQPDRTIRFAAFTNEEPPFFRTEDMGSIRYAKHCREANEAIVGMVCLEEIGYYTEAANSQKLPHPVLRLVAPAVGNFISFVGNFASTNLLKHCVASFRDCVQFPSEAVALPSIMAGSDFSDHASFWRFGYPAIMVTDTAFYRYPHYHEADDTPDKIDYENFARVVSGLQGVVSTLAASRTKLNR